MRQELHCVSSSSDGAAGHTTRAAGLRHIEWNAASHCEPDEHASRGPLQACTTFITACHRPLALR